VVFDRQLGWAIIPPTTYKQFRYLLHNRLFILYYLIFTSNFLFNPFVMNYVDII